MERGLTVDVSFDLAHFKVHTTMKSRASYIIPLPTTIIGFFFAILGKSREEYIKEREKFKAGARILDIKGICRENAQLLKLKRGRESRTSEEFIILFKPKYRFAIWGDKKTINLIYEKINNFEFEYVPYGGISDFLFFDIENPTIYDKYEESNILENSYVPKNILDSIEFAENSIIHNLPYIYYGKPKFVIMGMNVKFKLKKKISSIGGVPLYNCFLVY